MSKWQRDKRKTIESFLTYSCWSTYRLLCLYVDCVNFFCIIWSQNMKKIHGLLFNPWFSGRIGAVTISRWRQNSDISNFTPWLFCAFLYESSLFVLVKNTQKPRVRLIFNISTETRKSYHVGLLIGYVCNWQYTVLTSFFGAYEVLHSWLVQSSDRCRGTNPLDAVDYWGCHGHHNAHKKIMLFFHPF